MAALKVGQRVKKVRGISNRGITGKILDYSLLQEAHLKLGHDIAVQVDGPAENIKGEVRPSGTKLSFCSKDWEPILPEGQKAGDFSYEELLDHLKELSHENT